MSCTTVIQRATSVVVTRPECGQRTIVRAAAKTTVVASQPPAQNTVVLRGVRGLPGLDVELQKTATHIQWRVHKAGEPWADLVALSEITGPPSMADAPSDGTPYARKDGAWAAAATAAQGTAADNALPKAGGTMSGVITFAVGQTWPTFNQSTTGNAATATKLATARTIGGVSFDGSANINLPGVNTAGTQNTTGSAAKWTTARTLTLGGTGKSVDGSGNVTWTLSEMGAASSTALDAQLDIPAGSTNAIALSDRGKAVSISANTTIPTNSSVAFPIGSVVLLTCDSTARTITGPASNSLTLEGSATAVTSFTLKANKSAVIRKTGTDAWRVFGDV